MKKVVLIKQVNYQKPFMGSDGKLHPSVDIIAAESVEIDGKETYQNRVLITLAHPNGQYAKQYRSKLFSLCSVVETFGSIEDLKAKPEDLKKKVLSYPHKKDSDNA